jgi:hypothetical protein
MADETSLEPTPDLDGAATPNRDRRHEPPIIEGEAAELRQNADASVADAADARDARAEPAGEDPPVRLAPAKSARPILSAAIGALVGAVVAAGGLWLLDQRPAIAPEMAARLESLEKSLTAPNAALVALDQRVGALEAAMASAPDKAAVEAYGQRISALEAAALSAKGAVDANKELLAEAQAARADAAKALAAASAAAQSASGAPAPAAPATAASAIDASALEARLGKLEASLASLDRPPVDLAPVNQRLDKLEGALAAPKSETRAPAESAAPSRDWAGLAVAAQALSDRLGAGAPFGLEQTALEHLGADPAQLAILQPLAAKGAPTARALSADFANLSPAILAAAAPQNSGGVMDRLLANMSKVVKVTPVGEVAGDDPAALVSQIGAALERGQIGPAMAAWGRLPESARQASQPWAGAAQSRLAADKAAQNILDDAMTRLAAAKN